MYMAVFQSNLLSRGDYCEPLLPLRQMWLGLKKQHGGGDDDTALDYLGSPLSRTWDFGEI